MDRGAVRRLKGRTPPLSERGASSTVPCGGADAVVSIRCAFKDDLPQRQPRLSSRESRLWPQKRNYSHSSDLDRDHRPPGPTLRAAIEAVS